jgi:hypothetical protein
MVSGAQSKVFGANYSFQLLQKARESAASLAFCTRALEDRKIYIDEVLLIYTTWEAYCVYDNDSEGSYVGQ